MGKYNPDLLLAFASRFEKLAQSSELPGNSLMRTLASLTKTNPTEEEWKRWFDANKTALGDMADKYWEYNDYRSIYSFLGNRDEAFISTDSGEPYPDFERKAFASLRASPPIPALWLQVGQKERKTGPSVPPELGHYAWLVHGIDQILGGYSKKEIIEFLAKNRSKIDRVRRSFETQDPKYLGGGADGVAFDIGGGKVLKLFRDDISYQKALLAFDRLHKSPSLAKTEAMIYDVGILGKIGSYPDDPRSGRDVYYYIIEMMKPVRDLFADPWHTPVSRILAQIAKRLDEIKESKFRALKKVIQDPEKADQIKKVVRDAAIKMADDIKKDPAFKFDVRETKSVIPSLKDNWLELYVEEVIMKYLTGRTDLHMGNLGLTGYGELRYFDPAYGGHESHINV